MYLKKCFIIILMDNEIKDLVLGNDVPDRLVLESKLPQELASIIMDYKPRDREMKSSTAAVIKEKMLINSTDGEVTFYIIKQRRVYSDRYYDGDDDDDDDDDYEVWEWEKYRDVINLGEYSEKWWDRSGFLKRFKSDGHWWDNYLIWREVYAFIHH